MDVLKYPDERLRTVCKEVKELDDNIKEESKLMLDALKKIDSRLAIATGLAANQIGLTNRILVFRKFGGKRITMINPKIVGSFLPSVSIELCASLPKKVRLKIRKFFIRVRYQDLEARRKSMILFGSTAFIMQQELDHLDGRLMID